ncbi:putative ATP-binding cassette transporter [Roseiarcus fermentans]|uniref:Putative ATP-binding cassette transporter n=1 Tax=Roseiarcus fermentans TaxID=1473586 RepID=A0A366FRD7_9HYPH|nr:ATP-binding cassette domain-containing protein [Roseiarcus fermentans]RBP17253.1 putative ATP-binding cassette transporter [Roseiarcus fermentans]
MNPSRVETPFAQRAFRPLIGFLGAQVLGRLALSVALGAALYGDLDDVETLIMGLVFAAGSVSARVSFDLADIELSALCWIYAVHRQERFIRRVIAADPIGFQQFGAGRLSAILNRMLRSVAFFDLPLARLLSLAANVLAVLAMAVVFNALLGLSVLLVLAAAAGFVYLRNHPSRERRALAEGERVYEASVADLVSGFKELRLDPLRAAAILRDRFIPANAIIARAGGVRHRQDSATQTFRESLALTSAGVIALAAMAFFPAEKEAAGTVAVALLLLQTIALQSLPDGRQLRGALDALDDAERRLGSDPTPPPRPLPASVEVPRARAPRDAALARLIGPGPSTQAAELKRFAPPRLSLGDVVYRRPDPAPGISGFALGPVSCVFPPGSLSFIVGGNGSGKSTLMQLICGLARPQSGDIHLDDTPVDIASHRDLFTAVFADAHLYDRLYGLPAGVGPRINALLALLEIDHKTRVEGRAFTTLDLSSGQRRRVALAVALAETRPFLLLDEWAADQDPQFRKRFYSSILPTIAASGRTIIAVSHDSRYFDVADQIVRLDFGRLVPHATDTISLQAAADARRSPIPQSPG